MTCSRRGDLPAHWRNDSAVQRMRIVSVGDIDGDESHTFLRDIHDVAAIGDRFVVMAFDSADLPGRGEAREIDNVESGVRIRLNEHVAHERSVARWPSLRIPCFGEPRRVWIADVDQLYLSSPEHHRQIAAHLHA